MFEAENGQGPQNEGDMVQLWRCPLCRAEFEKKRSWQKFCRPQCKEAMKKQRKRKKIPCPEVRRGRVVPRFVWDMPPVHGKCPDCDARAYIIDGALNCCGRKLTTEKGEA